MMPRVLLKRLACAGLITSVACGAGWLFLPRPPLLEGVPFSQVIRDRDGGVLRVTLAADGRYRVFTPLTNVSPHLVRATLAYEDRHFDGHPGVNPVSVVRSLTDWLRSGRARSGASTVTMQVARLRYGLHTRTLPGKLHQMWRALQLERHYPKDRILEAYFNLAPYGGNVEGAGAASVLFLGKPAARLTLPESIALAVIPQRPAHRALRPGRDNTEALAAQARLAERLASGAGARAPVMPARPAAPRLAPPFALRAATRHRGEGDITTTLDRPAQQLVGRVVAQYLDERRVDGLRNAAVLLVDASTRGVRALVGSADFNDASLPGQVDGTGARRSPGSALKPFVYALAMDQGLVHPRSLVRDVPARFGDYNPENFDREFLGPIPAGDALARSRNVPAVDLAARLASPGLFGFLTNAGVVFPKTANHYGLALPLGGGEVTMQELAALYAALAEDGVWRPLRFTRDEPAPRARRVLSREASFLTLGMLASLPLPGAPDEAGRGVSWKTGTSHGFRDAWCVVVFDHQVLLVWLGNFDGRSNPALVGRSAAAPLAGRLVTALRAERMTVETSLGPPADANLREVEMCAVSGGLPTEACPHRVRGGFIPGVSPIAACDVHREELVDAATGLRRRQEDGVHEVRREVFEFWPGDVLTLFAQAGVRRRVPPPFVDGDAGGVAARVGRAPVILSPRGGTRYQLRSDTATGRQLTLHASCEAGVRRVFWFADRVFLGASSPAEPLVCSVSGTERSVRVVDDQGRSASCALSLEWVR